MKFTESWLKEHLLTDVSTAVVAETLTRIGIEVESYKTLGAGLESFTVAEILETEPHPAADKLRVCRVDTHTGVRQIVCGAPNARPGIKVILADIGDTIPANGMVIKAAKIRDVESNGMLCSARELGIGTDDNGIMELPAATLVGEKAVKILGLDDTLFDVSITPNRGDCLGVYGMARDLAAAGLGALVPLKPAAVHTTVLHTNSLDILSVQLETADCEHFIGYRFENIVNGPSPAWLIRKLESVGLRSISALVDITNYFTFTYGRPLHVYDADTLKGAITVRRSTEGETFEALNDKTYILPAGLCIVADDSGVLGLGGVMGGKRSGCTLTTTSVILEAAWFEPVAIAAAGRATYIDSDARYRFERGVDAQATAPYAAMAAAMIMELCGGKVTAYGEAGAPPIVSRTITFDRDAVRVRTGMDIGEAEQRSLLEAMGCHVQDWQVTTPSWRPDIEGSADLVEEITRLKGYDFLPETPLPAPEILKLPSVTVQEKVLSALLGRGMDETVHFAFTSKRYAEAFQTARPVIDVVNPISADLSAMRPHLFADLLPAVNRNLARGISGLAFMETGAVFFGVTPQDQPIRVSGVRTGAHAMYWQRKAELPTVYDVKADLECLLQALDINTDTLMVSKDVPDWYHPGKAGRLSLGSKQTVGYFGEIHPAILRIFDIDQPVMGFECWLDALPTKSKQRRPEAFRFNEFQSSRRDFAFVVDTDVPAGDIMQVIAKAEKMLLKHIVLFDVYEGPNMPSGKKSLAFAVTLQADDRTLTEEELSTVSTAIIKAAANKGAVLR